MPAAPPPLTTGTSTGTGTMAPQQPQRQPQTQTQKHPDRTVHPPPSQAQGPTAAAAASSRKRSRFGCRNCKLRKLKCDEAKPQCRRCVSFGVVCNSMSNVPDLQPASETQRTAIAPRHRRAQQQQQQQAPAPSAPVSSAIWTSDGSYEYHLDAMSQDFITRYLGRHLVGPNDAKMSELSSHLFRLSFTYPCLMHASLAVSFSYARHLTGAPRRTLQECYHSSQALSLFQRRLRRPVVPDRDGDPIWGTAAALVILAYLSAETTASWPLADATAAGPDGSDPCQLTWLTMSRGKSALQNLAKPFRPKSIFRIMGPTFADMHRTLPESGVAAIPPDLAAVCGLDESSTAESSPYFRLAHALSLILPLRDVDVTYGLTEVFVRSIDATVEANLRAKDPTTLLLLYLWYAKAGRCNWWVRLRSRVEGPPIKTFLLGLREGAKYAPFLDDEWLAKVERDDSDAQGDKPLALRRILAPPPSVVEGSR